ncbi:hypothetical protein CAPTEDRAFT_164999 [Capitella teleta]|uniref:O(6)-methylguanine-induced apoptosis 2 n=1 Tax=Capitella teleta TaxID=283909 RepID=R7UVN1_CAPTE|nr:hypothetical protein CAPTEDRAFT_164999 [Capitella teleta]|eukprot:ELU10374.1 hypothetical protein CAPTEDRAFT_164999 [Capitella teleta]
MTDGIRVLESSHVDRIHSTKAFGKLYKGHSTTPATASIPSQYQTIVIDNSDNKGFNSRSRRFQYDSDANVNPGPGSYKGHHGFESQASSYSKRGTGGFASKSRRLAKHQIAAGPGPGLYGLPGLLASKADHNKAGTSNFHKPIAIPKENLYCTDVPAPNVYDVSKAKAYVNKTNNVVANAAFKSGTKRDGLNIQGAAGKPSPSQYEINDTLVRDRVKVPLSSFKSKTQRNMKLDIGDNPGPGAYKPYAAVEPASKTLFPKKHYLCISAPAMPLPDTPPAPGPGSYEVTDFEGPSKHYMSSSVFVSTTSRWTSENRNIDRPGPAQYNPRSGAKQSFLFNAAGKWVA